MPDGSSRFSLNGQPILHYMGTSTFASHIVVPGIAPAKIRPDAPFDKVCCIGWGGTTGVGAVLFTAKVEAGANVVVFGLGGIGLNVIQGARKVGADKIIGVDINPAREAMARRFGATHFVNPREVPNIVGWYMEGKPDIDSLIDQLHPDVFESACAAVGQPLTLRRHAGCDHGCCFIATVIDDHLRHHAAQLA